MSKVIPMPDSTRPASPRITGVRDRRYTIRYPFAAVAELTDMQTGQKVDGVTSDISLGGCFICTNKALPMNCRARLKLTRKDQLFEALVVIRIVKPRVGLGIEFFDLDTPSNEILAGWIDSLRRPR
ncbi:MAG TPA: PilZ domain-containing protein [Candidatus Dormibacteraeota bacterium]|nr:PilZ domain-containing protein [Candidatus Dormibacteraeota bacterium]